MTASLTVFPGIASAPFPTMASRGRWSMRLRLAFGSALGFMSRRQSFVDRLRHYFVTRYLFFSEAPELGPIGRSGRIPRSLVTLPLGRGKNAFGNVRQVLPPWNRR